jgi:hypothetical protein
VTLPVRWTDSNYVAIGEHGRDDKRIRESGTDLPDVDQLYVRSGRSEIAGRRRGNERARSPAKRREATEGKPNRPKRHGARIKTGDRGELPEVPDWFG